MLTAREVAHRLGHCEEWLRQHSAELKAEGFPDMDPLLGRWDGYAIDRWLDARNGRKPRTSMRSASSLEAELVRRAQQWPASA